MDGLTVAGDEHLSLPLENKKYRDRANQYIGKLQFRRPLRPTPVSQLASNPLTKDRNRFEYSIPTAGSLQLPHKDLPVPPFVFGFWFFNHRKDGKVTTIPDTHHTVLKKFKDAGYSLTESWHLVNNRNTYVVSPSIKAHLLPDTPTSIPNNYLLSSAEQRIELLSGVMHAKRGLYNQKLDRFRFTNKNKTIVKQIQYLAESLGGKTALHYREDLKEFNLFITIKHKLLENQTPKPVKVRQHWRLITDVYEIKSQGCVHIETNGLDGSFLVGEGFIVCN